MPLMSSPIDGSPMREVERYGVKIDICPTSGGIWLDKGELEKMIMMVRQEALHEGHASTQPPPPPNYEQPYQPFEDDRRDRRPKGKKRDSMFDNIMDIFDF